MWRVPVEYITYDFVLTSPAVSCMSGSSNLDIFFFGGWWPYSFCFLFLQDLFNIVRSIIVQLLSSFLSIHLASMWCIHIAGLIRPLLGKKLLFILSGRSDFHITDSQSMAGLPLLVAYWCHFRWMRRCFHGRWTSLQVSEDHHLVGRCHLFD